MSKLENWLVVKTAAAWMAIAYVVCAVGVLILPTATLDLFWKPMFHLWGTQSLSGVSLLFGFVEAVVYAALAGWLFVALYNYFSKR